MPMFQNDHTYWMQKAMEKAKEGNSAFGAVIVNRKRHFISAHNTSKQDGPTAHAELNAIREMEKLEYESAEELTLYTTVEPCPMCMSAIVWAGIGEVVYGASIADASEFGRQIDITSEDVAKKAWYKIALKPGVEREKCVELFRI